uniref:Uncharacterized protein n=1 Tax=Vitis vinifera TaxID=29760 RepID=F6H929_VITVI
MSSTKEGFSSISEMTATIVVHGADLDGGLGAGFGIKVKTLPLSELGSHKLMENEP